MVDECCLGLFLLDCLLDSGSFFKGFFNAQAGDLLGEGLSVFGVAHGKDHGVQA